MTKVLKSYNFFWINSQGKNLADGFITQ